VESCFLPRTLP